MRGIAPMLTALAAWVLVGEALPLLASAGIAAIVPNVMLSKRTRLVGHWVERREDITKHGETLVA